MYLYLNFCCICISPETCHEADKDEDEQPISCARVDLSTHLTIIMKLIMMLIMMLILMLVMMLVMMTIII